MDSTLTQTMFMRGEVQLGKGLQLLRRKVISIPVLRGEVQQGHTFKYPYIVISIPVLRGEVQPVKVICPYCGLEFQFPYCVGKFNLIDNISVINLFNFNSRTAWGSSTRRTTHKIGQHIISIPVLRGEVQHQIDIAAISRGMISIPVLRGEVQQKKVLKSVKGKHFNSRTAWGSSTSN